MIIMEELMLKVVEKALEKDSIKNILKYDKKKDSAKIKGLCAYLLSVAKIRFRQDREVCFYCVDYVHYGKFHDWLIDNYIVIEGYIYPEYNEWGKRLEVLKLYKAHLESLIKKM